MHMDEGEFSLIASRLGMGALAAFFAIVLWSKVRDLAWMFVVIGIMTAYVETVYTILNRFGVTGDHFAIGRIPLAAIVLPNVRTAFFIAAFMVMVVRRLRRY